MAAAVVGLFVMLSFMPKYVCPNPDLESAVSWISYVPTSWGPGNPVV